MNNYREPAVDQFLFPIDLVIFPSADCEYLVQDVISFLLLPFRFLGWLAVSFYSRRYWRISETLTGTPV